MYPSSYDIYAVLVQLAFSLVPKLILGLILLIPTYFVVRQAEIGRASCRERV